MINIYQDGTYIYNNPSLHEEDSEYKLNYIFKLMKKVSFHGQMVRVLDVGGGAGIISARVCGLLAKQGYQVECHAFDLSEDMLAKQKNNNPFITLATSDFEQIRKNGEYQLALLIDVIEHIDDNKSFADEINYLAKYLIYNIPLERNLMDWLRNIYMSGRYYPLQTSSLGHVHFFSASSAQRFVRSHHQILCSFFADLSKHILESQFPNYIIQRKNLIRRVELNTSQFVYRWMNWLAPWLVQGSMFFLAQRRMRGNNEIN